MINHDAASYQDIADAFAGHSVGDLTRDEVLDNVTFYWFTNTEELGPGSTGRSEIRILFVFDPWQQIALLVAGDKTGDWRGWYRKAIPRAEQLYAGHLEAMSSVGAGDR